jgi:hypothetical protein
VEKIKRLGIDVSSEQRKELSGVKLGRLDWRGI